MTLDTFKAVWLVDFEFRQPDGERPEPHCLVAMEVRTGRLIRLFGEQLGPEPPYSMGPESLFVAYYASAELGCRELRRKAVAMKTDFQEGELFSSCRGMKNSIRLSFVYYHESDLHEGIARLKPLFD